jgi:cell division protein FtsA
MPRSEYESIIPAGLVLTGGTSNLSGIETLGRDILKLPVRVGVPSNVYGITDALRDPAYATSVGLLLWGAKNQGRRRWNGGGFFGRLRSLFSQFARVFR